MHLARVLSLGQLARLVAVAAALAVPLRQTAAQVTPKAAAPRPALQDSVFFAPGCKHDEVYNPSDIVCSDTSEMRLFSGHDIKSASITFVLNDGTSITQQLGRGFDAVFFSKLALQKFAIPYYKQANVTKAAMLETFVTRLTPLVRLKATPKPPTSPETGKP